MRYQRASLFVIVCLFLCTPAAWAETVYKCTDDAGKIVYQKEPCADELKGEKKDIDPNKNMVEGYRIPPPELSPPESNADQTKAPQKPAETTPRRRGHY